MAEKLAGVAKSRKIPWTSQRYLQVGCCCFAVSRTNARQQIPQACPADIFGFKLNPTRITKTTFPNPAGLPCGSFGFKLIRAPQLRRPCSEKQKNPLDEPGVFAGWCDRRLPCSEKQNYPLDKPGVFAGWLLLFCRFADKCKGTNPAGLPCGSFGFKLNPTRTTKPLPQSRRLGVRAGSQTLQHQRSIRLLNASAPRTSCSRAIHSSRVWAWAIFPGPKTITSSSSVSIPPSVP